MSVATGIAMYLIIWWTVLFAVLPIGTRPQAAPDAESGWRGAPERPGLARKALITTVVAVFVWLLAYWLITSPWLSFRTGWLALPE
jgi:predicted secreted protein